MVGRAKKKQPAVAAHPDADPIEECDEGNGGAGGSGAAPARDKKKGRKRGAKSATGSSQVAKEKRKPIKGKSFPAIEDKKDEDQGGDSDGQACVTITRGQKYIFDRDFELLPQAVQDEYHRLRTSKEPGKQRKMNAIVSTAVSDRSGTYKGNAVVNERVWAEFFTKTNKKWKSNSTTGMTCTEIRAKLGDKLLEEGLRCGDVIESVEGGRKFYHMARISTGMEMRVESHEECKQQNSAVAASSWDSMKQDLQTVDWADGLEHPQSESSLACGLADDSLMAKAQEAYDAIQISSTNVRKACRQLASGPADPAIVASALKMAKDVQIYLDRIEEFLVSDRRSLQDSPLRSCLLEAARSFQALRVKEFELSALVKAHKAITAS